MAFSLRSEDLDLPIPGLNIRFTGVPDRDNSTVTWSVNQSFDVWFSAVHITHAAGQIVTRVDEMSRSSGTTCSGEARIVEATLTTIGSANMITVSTSLGDATISNISTSAATALERVPAVHFDVRIHASETPHDGCGNTYQLQNTTVRFTAFVSNVRAVDGVSRTITGTTFEWEMPPVGVTVIGRLDEQTVEVRFDGHGPVSLTVHVTVTTAAAEHREESTVRFAVLTPEEAQLGSALCRLRYEAQASMPAVMFIAGIGAGFTIGDIRFVDPLWDPTPETLHNAQVLLSPYSSKELKQLHAAAGRIAEVAAIVTKQTSQLMEQARIDGNIKR